MKLKKPKKSTKRKPEPEESVTPETEEVVMSETESDEVVYQFSEETDSEETTVETVTDRVNDLSLMLDDIQADVDDLPGKLQVLLHQRKQQMIEECTPYSAQLEAHLLARVFEFLKDGPIWEIESVVEDHTGAIDQKQMKALYAKGYRYFARALPSNPVDPVCSLYHRPKLPRTVEEFQELYRIFRQKEKVVEKPTKKTTVKKSARKTARSSSQKSKSSKTRK